MKRRNRILQTVILLAGVAIGLCGCGNDSADGKKGDGGIAETIEAPADAGAEESAQAPSETEGGDKSADNGFYFDAEGVRITVDLDMDAYVPQLKESKSVYDAPSCAGEGVSYIYNFGSYQIETYPDGSGVNRIGNIILKDDTVCTEEGIDLSMTKADVIRVYGDVYEEVGNMISYEKGGCKLQFIFDGESIVSIEYVSSVLG